MSARGRTVMITSLKAMIGVFTVVVVLTGTHS